MQNDNQMNPAASSEITSVNSFSALFSQDFMNEIRQIGITEMKRSIDQIPAPDNGHTAICSVQLATSQGNFSDFGVATPDSIGGSTDAGELLEKASHRGTEKAFGMALFAHTAQPVLDITPCSPREMKSSTDREKLPVNTSPAQDQGHSSKTGNGGGSKPASGKQLSWIEAMCLRQAVAPENVAREICAKPLEKLTGADANKIIQTLRQNQS
ncbi:hypothetical protein [uncultured Desulfovibrio sp.]|uniref:hypothetical protein n=1 Tax=uncultured Desulfovibrio sp. TaxID=167968 RepID=UPI00258A7993|nr:hypothetical protein [uncultured Desulfovibrio sp.]